MSDYDRSYYAPPKALPARSAKRTVPPPWETLMFVTEWYWLPEGVKEVSERIEKFLADNQITATHTWNVEYHWFEVQCRYEYKDQLTEACWSIMGDIIKEELRKAYKPFFYDGRFIYVPEPLQNGVPVEEGESFKLDENESLGSRSIRRLRIWELEERERRNEKARILATSQLPNISEELSEDENSTSSEIFVFQSTWDRYVGMGSKLDQAFPDKTLEELMAITGCEISKSITTGDLYIRSGTKEDIECAVSKVDNLARIFESKPYVGHILYTESVVNNKYLVFPMATLPNSYFHATLLDNVTLAIGKGQISANGLAPAWQKLINSITVRDTYYDPKSCVWKPNKKVVALKIPDVSTSSEFNPWGNFEYCARGRTNPLVHYTDPVLNSHPLRMHRQLDDDTRQKILRIEEWQEEVSKVSITVTDMDANSKEDYAEKSLSVEKEAEASIVSTWDTYVDPDVNKIKPVGHRKRNLANSSSEFNSTNNTIMTSTLASFAPVGTAYGHHTPSLAIHWRRMLQSDSVTPTFIGSKFLKRSHSLQTASLCQPPGNPGHPGHLGLPGHPGHPEPALSEVSSAPLIDMESSYNSGTKKFKFAKSNQLIADCQSPTILDEDVPKHAGPDLIIRPAILSQPQTITQSMQMPMPVLEVSSRLEVEEDLMSFTSEAPPGLTPDATVISSNEASQIAEKPVQDELQEKNEVSTRKYHATMNQKAGKKYNKQKQANPPRPVAQLPLPSPPPPPRPKLAKSQEVVEEKVLEDPLHIFVEDAVIHFSNMMNNVRLFQGQLIVQVEFGRIFLSHPDYSAVFRNPAASIKSVRKMQEILATAYDESQIGFTRVLSRLPQEMEYLIATKDKERKDLWNPSQPKRSVTYEFRFQDLEAVNSPVFLLQIDGETFKSELLVRRELGKTYIWAPFRQWDSRIAAIGYENSTCSTEKPRKLQAAIDSSLYIRPGTEVPRLYWELQDGLEEQFELEELLVKRVLKYDSCDGGSVLHLTEIQSLEVESRSIDGKPTTLFLSGPDKDDNPTERLTTWWEASISSVKLDQALEENRGLELGNAPTWTSEELMASMAAADLCLPACDMLKQMDLIGQQNQNFVPDWALQKTTLDKKKKKKAEIFGDDGFW